VLFKALTSKSAHPERVCAGERFASQPGFTDTWLPSQHDQPHLADRDGVVDRGQHTFQLCGAPNHRRIDNAMTGS